MRNVKKFYGNPKKTLMYDIQVNNKGLIGGIEFRGPDRKKIFKGAIDVEKNPNKSLDCPNYIGTYYKYKNCRS